MNICTGFHGNPAAVPLEKRERWSICVFVLFIQLTQDLLRYKAQVATTAFSWERSIPRHSCLTIGGSWCDAESNSGWHFQDGREKIRDKRRGMEIEIDKNKRQGRGKSYIMSWDVNVEYYKTRWIQRRGRRSADTLRVESKYAHRVLSVFSSHLGVMLSV